ncbi:MAG TPA: hypothetical protein VLZ84_09385, partial [Asticcacaulis sp.]|nr:hypothetical protein [Asticcacaulis sp.]
KGIAVLSDLRKAVILVVLALLSVVIRAVQEARPDLVWVQECPHGRETRHGGGRPCIYWRACIISL